MPSEYFFRALDAVYGTPDEDLPYLYGVLTKEMSRRGMRMPETGGLTPQEELAGKAMVTLQRGDNLVGWEMALLAGVVTLFGTQFGKGEVEAFASRDVTNELNRVQKTIANITSVMDTLQERGLVETVEGDAKKGAHKSFKVTAKGEAETMRIWQRVCGTEKRGIA
ncbi:MAG: hypothetical protein KA004_01775 [Verrucomicrobiales bacterium]|nr:hypothetical protein [Verrucomicrobiales bacterium]